MSLSTGLEQWRVEHYWVDYLGRRLLRLVISLVVLVTLTFSMLYLIPGDPVRAALGADVSEEVVTARRHQLGLDQPFLQQYLGYFGRLAQGDLGSSLINQIPVSDLLWQRFIESFKLGALAFVVVIAGSLLLGSVMAMVTKNGLRPRTEQAFTLVTSAVDSIPGFLVAVGLVYVFSVTFGLLPVAGSSSGGSFILPVLALSLGAMMALSRIVRVEMIKVLREEYMLTARSKRLAAVGLYVKHVFPNMLTAFLTLGGMMLVGLVTGSVLIERVFAWPGLGTLVVDSILSKDYPVAQATILLFGILVLVINLVVDVALALIDPRSTIREH